VVEPQIPAVACTLCIIVPLWLLRPLVVDGPLSVAAAIRYGGAGATLAAVVYLAFIRYSPFAELRVVATEIIEDLVPALGPLVRVGK
jgi:hypothetical protein